MRLRSLVCIAILLATALPAHAQDAERSAVLATVHVNPGLIAIVLGVDRILDMCRTTLNVVGDLTAATYVARAEGYELLKPRAPAGHPALAED